jgi:O-antigen ligase
VRGAPTRRAPGLAAWALTAYVFFLPVQFTIEEPYRLAPSDLFLVAYLVLRLPSLRIVHRAWSSWHLCLVAVVSLGCLTAVLTTGALTSWAVVQKGLGLLMLELGFLAVTDHCRDRARIRHLCRVLVVTVVLNAVLSIVALVAQSNGLLAFDRLNFADTRLAGFLVDPNAFGGIVVVALLLHLATAGTDARLLGRRGARVAAVVLPLALLLTYSRSAWMGALAGGALVAFLERRRLLRALGRAAVPLAVVAALVAVVWLPDLAELASRPEQVQDRVELIREALDEATSHPVLGIGLGSFQARHDNIVHNTAMWFLAELGLVGLLVLIGFLLSPVARLLACARRGGRDRPLAVGLLGAHVGMIGVSFGIEALYQRYWWFVLAAAGALFAQGAPAPAPRSEPAEEAEGPPAVLVPA